MNTKQDWAVRKSIALKNVCTNLSELITKAKDRNDKTSLAIVKPKEVIDFVWEKCEREWSKKKMDAVYANQAQGSLFDIEETKAIFKVVKKLPYKFSYKFITEDNIVRTIMIEDWELGALYWNCLRDTNGNEELACKKVRERYFDWMYKDRDLYFFMGTTKLHHFVAPNPFIIIGAFYPPQIDTSQLTLFG